MTMTLAHPAAEDLGRFVEGTIDDAGRTAVVTHIADCDECRIVVVDAAEFVEPVTKSHWYRWVGIAAAAVLLVGMGSFTRLEYRLEAAGGTIDILRDAGQFLKDALRTSPFNDPNPVAKVAESSYPDLKERAFEGRLSGFPYRPYKPMRGAKDDPDMTLAIMQGDAVSLTALHGNDAWILHARGIGFLLTNHAPESLTPLTSAVAREPMNARYQNDLAVALIAAGQHDPRKLQQALASADRAVQLDPKSPEALYNRGAALELLGQTKEAIAVYSHYLKVFPTSPGADEARKHLESLQEH